MAQSQAKSDTAAAAGAEVEAIFSQGLAYHRAAMLPEAEQHYRRVLAAYPEHFDSTHLLGVIYFQRGEFSKALQQIDAALRIKPDVADAHNNRGNVLKRLRRFDEALASYDQAIAYHPQDAASYNNRGSAYKDLKRLEEASADFDRAIALKPDFAEAFNNRGNVLLALQRFEAALANYDRAIALKPNDADALNNRGNALKELKRFEEALASYDRAIRLKPEYERAHYNRGVVLFDLDRFEDSILDLNKAIGLNPDHAEAFYNRGNALRELNRVAEAAVDFDRAIALRPDYPDAVWNRALAKLRLGHYQEAWSDFEWRWHISQVSDRRTLHQRQWSGKADIRGKTIFLHSEQGFGDTIMMARYIDAVAATGARVIVEVAPQLGPLMSRFADTAEIVLEGRTPSSFDLHCPMMSLPAAFGTTVETIPAHVPYLTVPSSHADKWARLLPPSGRKRVGIYWAGNPMHREDHKRSIGLRHLLPLLSRQDLQFFSLQKDLRDGDAELLRLNPQVTPLGEMIDSLTDTAAIMRALDLVISVDAVAAHLAGALAKPVWVLLPFVPDWRWLLDREDSPWYPTARLFRQSERGDWASVVAKVEQALAGLAR
jgi:tetratricopeptide (TPR) repeat protein